MLTGRRFRARPPETWKSLPDSRRRAAADHGHGSARGSGKRNTARDRAEAIRRFRPSGFRRARCLPADPVTRRHLGVSQGGPSRFGALCAGAAATEGRAGAWCGRGVRART